MGLQHISAGRPAMIKLIATDVDGTLLDRRSSLPELNRQALDDCRKEGMGIILATGKSIAAIIPLIKTLGLELPQITLNGAVTVNEKLEIINAVRVLPEQYCEVIKTIKEKGYRPLIALSNGNILYDSYDQHYSVFNEINEPIFRVEKLENPV
ncbi:MAG: HAD family phosphatase, partial [Actinobacteria bacterium]|nr:HAD family phosphatase [Actinomycetota bacterium]